MGVLVMVVYFMGHQRTPVEVPLQIATTTITSTTQTTTEPEERWASYTNTTYGYTLKYPSSVTPSAVAPEERLPVEQSFFVVIDGEHHGAITIFARKAFTYNGIAPDALEQNRIANLDIKSFAETLWQKEVSVVNPNFPNRKVGKLEEITFANHKAYAMTVTGYTDNNGSAAFRTIYLDAGTHKLVIQYPLKDDIFKRIIDTFQLTR